MKEEEKHSSPVISSRNPSCNLRNQNSSFWEVPHSVCGGGQPYSHLMVQYRGFCPAPSPKDGPGALS